MKHTIWNHGYVKNKTLNNNNSMVNVSQYMYTIISQELTHSWQSLSCFFTHSPWKPNQPLFRTQIQRIIEDVVSSSVRLGGWGCLFLCFLLAFGHRRRSVGKYVICENMKTEVSTSMQFIGYLNHPTYLTIYSHTKQSSMKMECD